VAVVEEEHFLQELQDQAHTAVVTGAMAQVVNQQHQTLVAAEAAVDEVAAEAVHQAL